MNQQNVQDIYTGFDEYKKITIMEKVLFVISQILFWLGVGFLVIGKDLAKVGVLIVIGIVLFLLRIHLASVRGTINKKIKELLAKEERRILGEYFDILSYNPYDYMDRISLSQMNLLPKYDKIIGEDYLKGRYRGYPMEYSELCLEQETEDAERNRTYITVFSGCVLRLYTGKKLNGEMYIRNKADIVNRKSSDKYDNFIQNRFRSEENRLEIVETENVAFTKRFQTFAEDSHTAFYVLTPQFMEKLMQIDNESGAKTQFSFRDGYINITLEGKWNLFSMREYMKQDEQKGIIEKMHSQVRRITDILDLLIDNDALWKK